MYIRNVCYLSFRSEVETLRDVSYRHILSFTITEFSTQFSDPSESDALVRELKINAVIFRLYKI